METEETQKNTLQEVSIGSRFCITHKTDASLHYSSRYSHIHTIGTFPARLQYDIPKNWLSGVHEIILHLTSLQNFIGNEFNAFKISMVINFMPLKSSTVHRSDTQSSPIES